MMLRTITRSAIARRRPCAALAGSSLDGAALQRNQRPHNSTSAALRPPRPRILFAAAHDSTTASLLRPQKQLVRRASTGPDAGPNAGRPEPRRGKLEALAALARVDAPAGTLLLYWPGAWSIALAAPAGHLPDLKLLGLFGVGAFVMRGAGCAINDIWDRDFDGKVERTKRRPLAAGELTVSEAVGFLGLQLALGLGVLTQLNLESIVLGACSVPLVVAYPLAKRFFPMPQLVLGLTFDAALFNWGALLGYCAATGAVDSSVCLPLYGGCVAWTLLYDTLYAHQDKADDRKIGLRSSALALGDAGTPPFLRACAAATVAGVGLAGANAGLGPTDLAALPFYVSLGAFGGHLAWQVETADLSDPANLGARFRANAFVAPVVLGGVVGATLLGAGG